MSGTRYRITRRLGHGGMAEVFEAELAGELGFVRKVAIKRMLADAAADRVSAQRFLDEARIASRLHHANIVSVLDVGLLDGLPFQVLELVDGRNAQQLGVLPVDLALIVAAEVAHALDHAHTALDDSGVSLGIVHRDVKPSNVMVSWAGDVKLSDFGIAVAHDRVMRTEAGMVSGTMGFMAPEQRTRGQLDGRTDVFALGLTLHAMLADYTPLRDVAVEMAAMAGTPIPLDAAIPPDVATVIARAVDPQRIARPTAAELAEELGRVIAARGIGDRRAMLRRHLEGVEGSPQSRPKRGALDALLGLDVVPTKELAAGEPAHYELRPTASEKVTTAEKRIPLPPPPKRSRAGIAVGAVALAAVAGGGVAWLLRGGNEVAPEHLEARVDPPPVSLDARPQEIDAAVARQIDAAVAREIDAGIDAGQRHADPPPKRVDPPPSGRGPRTEDRGPIPDGYLKVTGAELVGARVYVDGGLAGYVPNILTVARGHHSVVVEKRDGTKLDPAGVDITDLTTPTSPAHLAL